MTPATETLEAWVSDARARTLRLAASLRPEELLGPRLAIVNPPLWELGHVAWFQERWVLRHAAGRPPTRADGDALYDSSAVPHDARWTLPLPSLEETVRWLAAVGDAVVARLAEGVPGDAYFARLAVLHEDMHAEAMAFTRQTLGLAPPPPEPAAAGRAATPPAGTLAGDVHHPGGVVEVGARPGDPFAFDNELRAREVVLAPFSIARAPVTQSAFREFVEDAGYARRELWTDEGWRWREAADASHPVYWRREGRGWLRRDFRAWVPLEADRPAVNVCAHEADAWCRWARRRLPSEAEWEAAAAWPGAGAPATARRRYPWGESPPDGSRAHLGFAALEPLDVGALPAGDGALGCRQLLGNVWEWTSSPFEPYPGFAPGPYHDYSAPWFRTHRALRGGSFATAPRLVHAAFRNFYTPDRRDPWAGFRTCAA